VFDLHLTRPFKHETLTSFHNYIDDAWRAPILRYEVDRYGGHEQVLSYAAHLCGAAITESVCRSATEGHSKVRHSKVTGDCGAKALQIHPRLRQYPTRYR